MAQRKNPPANAGDMFRSLLWKDPSQAAEQPSPYLQLLSLGSAAHDQGCWSRLALEPAPATGEAYEMRSSSKFQRTSSPAHCSQRKPVAAVKTQHGQYKWIQMKNKVCCMSLQKQNERSRALHREKGPRAP